jgi:hypothetical protein
MNRLLAAVLLLASALPLSASAPEEIVARMLVDHVDRILDGQGAPIVIVADETRGGGDQFAAEWLLKWRGRVIALEVAEAYREGNRQVYDVTEAIGGERKLFDAELCGGGTCDWEALDRIEPGVRAALVLSRPAFDRLETVALVRMDVIRRDLPPSSRFVTFEKQPGGEWKLNIAAVGGFEMMRRESVHLHEDDDSAYFHEP